MFSPVSSIQVALVVPIRRGISAAWITDGMPTFTSGMPNTASVLARRRSQAIATSSPPPSAQPARRPITGVGKR